MKKLKDSKGAATLFVLIAGLFFISFILSVLMLASAKRQSQIEIGKHTQEIYNELNQDRINEVKNIVPIYTKEQLLKIGSGEEIAIEKENGKKYVYSPDAYYILNSDIELEYNGIWDISQYNIDEAGYKIKIKDTSKPETAYYYYVDKYNYPVTENGFKYENLVLHFDGTNNTGSGHSDNTQYWKDLSGNGNNGTLTNFSYSSSSGWHTDRLTFDGKSSYIILNDNPLYTENEYTEYTLNLVMELKENKQQTLFCNRTEMSEGISVHVLTESNVRCDNGNLMWDTEHELPINQKVNINIVKNENEIALYIDGQLVKISTRVGDKTCLHEGETTIGAAQIKNTTTGVLGSWSNFINGDIYLVNIYDKALTEQEVKNNYEAEKQKSQKEIVKYSKDQIVLDIDTSYASINGNTITDTTSGEQYTLQNGSWNSDKSMNFDGTTYMQCGHGGEFDGATEISIASTFEVESFEYDTSISEQHIISTTQTGGYALFIRKNKISFTIYADDKYYILQDTEELLGFEKYNVIGTYDGFQMKLYVNGKFKSFLNVESQIEDATQLPITIGVNPRANTSNQDCVFKGNVYDAKVYKKALSQEEINKYFTYARQTFDTPGITPTYTYRITNRILDMDSRKANGGTSVNSGSTATWYDLAQSTNRTLTNFAYDRTSGWDNNGGLIFDGTDDYISCGKAKNLNGTNSLTISATVKPQTMTGNGIIIANVESAGYGIYVNSNMQFVSIIRTESGTGAYREVYSETVQADKIYNVIFTFDGTKLRIFLNGKEGTPLNLSSAQTIVDKVEMYNTLGGNPNTNNVATQEFFKGVIYDVKIYDAVLTDSEIQQLWEHQNHQYAIQK